MPAHPQVADPDLSAMIGYLLQQYSGRATAAERRCVANEGGDGGKPSASLCRVHRVRPGGAKPDLAVPGYFLAAAVFFRSRAIFRCSWSTGSVFAANCRTSSESPFFEVFSKSFTAFSWSFTIA